MATHSRILAWENPWSEKPGVLESMGLQTASHDLVTEQQQQEATDLDILYPSFLVWPILTRKDQAPAAKPPGTQEVLTPSPKDFSLAIVLLTKGNKDSAF